MNKKLLMIAGLFCLAVVQSPAQTFERQAARTGRRISGKGPAVRQGPPGPAEKRATSMDQLMEAAGDKTIFDLSGPPAAEVPVDPPRQASGSKISGIAPELVGAAGRIKKPRGWSPMPDYAGLTRDGKLDIRIFVGYDEEGNDQKLFTAIRVSLGANGWVRMDDAGMPALFSKSLNIGGKTAVATVKMSLGRLMKRPGKVLTEDLKSGGIVIYNGHSTHGRGLMAGKNIMVPISENSFSQENRSQLLFIAACESEKYYEKDIRAATKSRDPGTLDLLLTTRDMKMSEFISQLLYSIEEEADFDGLTRALSAAHGSSYLWDGDTTPNDLFQDQITYDTRRGAPARLTPEAALWGLANGELHLHLRALPEKVAIPGPVVGAELPGYARAAMESIWRRLVISGSANERTEWKKKLKNAIDELDKLLVNCKDNAAQFVWDPGVWHWNEKKGGVQGSPLYDELAEVKKRYEEDLKIARDPYSLAKARDTLVPRWLNEHNGQAYVK